MTQRDSTTSDRPKSIRQILDEQIKTGLHEFKRSNTGLFISAFTAGLEIGFSILLRATLHSLFVSHTDADMLNLIVAPGYPLGFIFVVIGRSELFTEHTAMAMLPVLNKSVTWRNLFACGIRRGVCRHAQLPGDRYSRLSALFAVGCGGQCIGRRGFCRDFCRDIEVQSRKKKLD